MEIMQQRITIIRFRKPVKKTLNDELQFFGNSLGLFGDRDKDKSCFRVFIELLKAGRANHPMSSDEIAIKTDLSRGTVVYHLHRLIEAGLVMEEQNRYILRAGNLEAIMGEIKKDLNRTVDDLKNMAKDIDRGLGL